MVLNRGSFSFFSSRSSGVAASNSAFALSNAAQNLVALPKPSPSFFSSRSFGVAATYAASFACASGVFAFSGASLSSAATTFPTTARVLSGSAPVPLVSVSPFASMRA